jgi:sporulation protein YlmC with PRC-barrel domain
MPTEFTIGVRAGCSDGYCGELIRIITDPATRKITHLVIKPQHHRRHPDRLVPVELVDMTADDISLRCTLAEFDELQPAEEIDLAEGDAYGGGYGDAESVQGYGNVGSMGVGGSISGRGVGTGVGHRTRTVTHHVVPMDEAELRPGESVHAVDGEIGQVLGFIVDPDDQRVTHVILKEGHLWGRREVAIPISAVTAIDEGIRLNITKQQVEDLPPAH